MKADPEHKKKRHDSKYQKGKKNDAEKLGVRKNRSRRDIRSRDLSNHELRERRRAHSPEKKSNRSRHSPPPSPPKPAPQKAPRKFLVDPPKVVKRIPVAPAVPLPVVETKEKKKKSKPPSNETVKAAVSTPSVPEAKYGKIWGFVNRQTIHTPVSNSNPDVPPSPPPETIKSPKSKRQKEPKEPKELKEPGSPLDLPTRSKSKHKTAVFSLTESIKIKNRSKSKTVFDSVPEPSYSRGGASSDKHGNFAKRFLRKQVWAVSKPYIKRNARLSQLLKDSKVNIDKIKINALGLDVINVDALGIKNKALKKSVIWLLK